MVRTQKALKRPIAKCYINFFMCKGNVRKCIFTLFHFYLFNVFIIFLF